MLRPFQHFRLFPIAVGVFRQSHSQRDEDAVGGSQLDLGASVFSFTLPESVFSPVCKKRQHILMSSLRPISASTARLGSVSYPENRPRRRFSCATSRNSLSPVHAPETVSIVANACGIDGINEDSSLVRAISMQLSAHGLGPVPPK
jgi:hypothetical protein